MRGVHIDYVDQLTLLLFLKMARERADRKSFGAKEIVPSHLGWANHASSGRGPASTCTVAALGR
jgi:hypothetical protein